MRACLRACVVIFHEEMGSEQMSFAVFQTIAFLVYLVGRLNDEGPFLILCPLSVLSSWKEELERYRVNQMKFYSLRYFLRYSLRYFGWCRKCG